MLVNSIKFFDTNKEISRLNLINVDNKYHIELNSKDHSRKIYNDIYCEDIAYHMFANYVLYLENNTDLRRV